MGACSADGAGGAGSPASAMLSYVLLRVLVYIASIFSLN